MIPKKYLKNDALLDDPRVTFVMRSKAKAVLEDMRGQGYPLVVFEAYRTKARAAWLKVTGKSQVGNKSMHCLGLAVDMVFCIDSKLTWAPPAGYWEKYAQCAEAHQLVSGYRWKSFPDAAHIQLGN